MYTAAKVAALCAHLLVHQQESLETFNRFAYYSRGVPMVEVNASPVAVLARNAQAQYNRYCQ